MPADASSSLGESLRRQLRLRWGLLGVLVVIALVAAVRIRLLDLPLERDEGEYAYAGQLLLQGILPYKLAYAMKFPGTYAAYAAIMAVFGESPAGIHFGLMVTTSLTALLLYWLGRRLLDETAGFVAGSAYAVLAADSNMLGLAGHATHFAALCATAAFCLLWWSREPLSHPRAWAAGLLLGLTLLMKQQAAFLLILGLALAGAAAVRSRGIPAARRAQVLAGFCAGMLLPFVLMCLLLWQGGVFGRFWFWTVDYAPKYLARIPLRLAPEMFWQIFRDVLANGRWIWAVAAAGLGLIWFDARLRPVRLGLFGFAVASFLTTCPGFIFRRHYFLLLLPAVALLAGCAVSVIRFRGRAKPGSLVPGSWPVLAWIVVLAVFAFGNRQVWFQLRPVEVSRLLYVGNPFPEAVAAATFIRTNSAPDATIAVLGSEPEIYFLAQRHSATGYIYTYPLMEIQPFARQMQLEMIREIEAARPEYAVFVLDDISWLAKHNSEHVIFDWWIDWSRTNYQLLGTVVLPETERRAELEVFKRKPSASP